LWQQIVAVLIVLAAIGGLVALANGGGGTVADSGERTVTLSTVGALSGTNSGVSIVGTVRSVSQADILAQAGGTVRSVNTSAGHAVPAGFVIASLDNSSESAAVLQAQGAYDGAIAARQITALQSGNANTSFTEAGTAARTAYRTAFTTMDSTVHDDIDTLFGAPAPLGPTLLISSRVDNSLPQARRHLDDILAAWSSKLATADSTDPTTLLDQATTDTQAISDFLVRLSSAAHENGSGASAAQLAALAAAQANVNATLAQLSGARDAYNAKQTAAQVGSQQSAGSSAAAASADASVKQALGALRAAQAVYEKTVVRAPIGGTVNFLPIHVGDYVTAFTHVATVAQNGALEIVTYVSEGNRQNLSVGMKVRIEDTYDGVVTSIAPALDPVTKQIEVHIAVSGTTALENGQSVRISFADATSLAPVQQAATSTSPVLLPLTALKLTPSARVVFSVSSDGRLVSNPVTIGDVVGDRIQITSSLPSDLKIVTDARGLSDGEQVKVATSTPQ
jgi:RND family efflux transporter MFP subunit